MTTLTSVIILNSLESIRFVELKYTVMNDLVACHNLVIDTHETHWAKTNNNKN